MLTEGIKSKKESTRDYPKKPRQDDERLLTLTVGDFNRLYIDWL